MKYKLITNEFEHHQLPKGSIGEFVMTEFDYKILSFGDIGQLAVFNHQIEEVKEDQSKRYNEGKVQTREIDPAFILGIGEVLTKSRQKYDHFNWCKPTKLSTPYESMMRHIMAFQSGEELDKETSSHHLLHAATNLMFMYYHITNNPEESDDRFFKKDK